MLTTLFSKRAIRGTFSRKLSIYASVMISFYPKHWSHPFIIFLFFYETVAGRNQERMNLTIPNMFFCLQHACHGIMSTEEVSVVVY